jgi:hypothetical protein
MSLNLRCPRLHGVFDLRSKSELFVLRVSDLLFNRVLRTVTQASITCEKSRLQHQFILNLLVTCPVIIAVQVARQN